MEFKFKSVLDSRPGSHLPDIKTSGNSKGLPGTVDHRQIPVQVLKISKWTLD